MIRILVIACACLLATRSLQGQLLVGTARVDITDHKAGAVNDPSFAKALVLRHGKGSAVVVTLDAVAVGGIGRVGNGFMKTVRTALEQELGVSEASVFVNASHCHGIVRGDLEPLVIQAVKDAWRDAVPARVGSGSARETRISENRRLLMKDGTEVDMRRAYAMPKEENIASVGPIDPEVGLVRIDRMDGSPLAVVYQFACHPIMNPPSKGSSADFPGHASKVIEGALGSGAMAFFIQGCGGDINPVRYKETTRPADAESLGTLLGATVLAEVWKIETQENSTIQSSSEKLALPRAVDYQNRIDAIEAQQKKLLAALRPTNINFKSFLPLLIQHRLWPDMPSHHAQSYLHDRARGLEAIPQLDADNRLLLDAYLQNIDIMEQLTRLNTNLALLRKHQAETQASGQTSLEVEIGGLRIGEFKLVTFPGEIAVQVGLNLKKSAAIPTAFVSGYTNGYIYYTPTAAQRSNSGFAQEDCDTLVAPEWQKIFETKALEVLRRL